jgi:uncharacterized membrane protein
MARQPLPMTVADATDAPTRLRRRLVAAPSLGSWIGVLVLWWLSLRPSLLPRSALIQAVITAICVAVGYGLGGLADRLVARAARRRNRVLSPAARRSVVVALAIVTFVVVALGSSRWLAWQRDQRMLVQLDELSWTSVPVMLVLSTLVSVVIIEVARLLRHLLARIDRAVAQRLQRRAARWTVAAIVTVGVFVLATFAAQRFANWADTNFGAFDETTADGVEPPTSPMSSGSPESFVDWDTLGFEGRNFVASAPTVADLESFDGGPAVEPIRVYVGLDSAGSVEERIDLAVAELARTGAFERAVLVAVTPTGTGWVDPDAARTIEYMYGGDTAIVSVQYSFLPSWIAFLLDTTSPKELGDALFDGIHDAWAALPADDRPVLLAFGQSLGSLGGEAAFAEADASASIVSITSRYDGALFTGPTRDNAIYGRLVDERDAGSPSWKPTVAAEPNVRVVNRISDIDASDVSWESPRVLWVHHPSDAIGTWRFANLWRPPGWAEDPAPYDVPPAATWVPFVTFVQESFDLMAGFSATPGFGHDYRTDFVHSWAAIAPPDAWSAADSDRLRTHLGLDGGP